MTLGYQHINHCRKSLSFLFSSCIWLCFLVFMLSRKKRVSVEISIEESLFMKNAEQKVPLHAKDTWLSRPAVLLILLKWEGRLIQKLTCDHQRSCRKRYYLKDCCCRQHLKIDICCSYCCWSSGYERLEWRWSLHAASRVSLVEILRVEPSTCQRDKWASSWSKPTSPGTRFWTKFFLSC